MLGHEHEHERPSVEASRGTCGRYKAPLICNVGTWLRRKEARLVWTLSNNKKVQGQPGPREGGGEKLTGRWRALSLCRCARGSSRVWGLGATCCCVFFSHSGHTPRRHEAMRPSVCSSYLNSLTIRSSTQPHWRLSMVSGLFAWHKGDNVQN